MGLRSSLFPVVCALVLSTSCTFPEVTFDATAAGGSGTTGTTTGTAGNGGNGGSGAGEGGGGTSTSTSAGGSGGTTSTSSSTAASGGSGGATCPEDGDDDTFLSWCAGGPDCADEDPTANSEAGFDSAPITGATKPNTNPYDRDCDGSVERETAAIMCKVGSCNAEGYDQDVDCGQLGVLGHCVPVLGIGCKWEAYSPTIMKQQKCK
jgi:hypothetical protein